MGNVNMGLAAVALLAVGVAVGFAFSWYDAPAPAPDPEAAMLREDALRRTVSDLERRIDGPPAVVDRGSAFNSVDVRTN